MDQKEMRALRNRFKQQYERKAGTIPNGDGEAVILIGNSVSTGCAESYAAEYGCPSNEEALLIIYISASELPELLDDLKAEVISFPSRFESINVYYKRGEKPRAY